MRKLYEKSEIWFTVVWIVIYVTGNSVCESLSEMVGFTSSVTLAFNIILSALLYFWIRKNQLLEKYGLCRATERPKVFLYYIPLAILVTHNLWLGFAVNFPFSDTVCYIGSMLCVGFLEEVIFRGLLFKALGKDGVKTAVIVSSLMFAIGHVVNLFNGSGMTLADNLFQIFGAIAIGFLFVVIFYRSGSLVSCIITHGLYNSCSAFANVAGFTGSRRIIINAVQFVLVVLYAVYILKQPEGARE